jgi:hypothetical protein
MSIILMNLHTMEAYKADIILSEDKNEKCINDAWIQFAFDNTLQVGDKVCFSVDFDFDKVCFFLSRSEANCAKFNEFVI